MRHNRNLRVALLITLLVMGLFLAVVYAALSQNLTIRGTASMQAEKWSIRFSSVEARIEGNAKYTLPKLEATTLNGYSVTLSDKNDSVTFDIEVTNDGSIDAELNSISKLQPKCTGLNSITATAESDANIVCSNLNYTFTYDDGQEILPGNVLEAGQTKKLKLTFSAKPTSEPSDDVIVSNLDISLLYTQK